MGKLEKLEKELYGEAEDNIQQRMKRRIFFPGTLSKIKTTWGAAELVKQTPRFGGRNVLKLLFGAFGVVLIAIGAAFVFLYLGTRGQEAEITIYDRGVLESGELFTLPIRFKNVSKNTLEEVELTVILPAGSLLSDGLSESPAPSRIITKIKNLAPGEEDSVEITARFFGHEGEEVPVEATLLYRPQSLRARFSSKTVKVFSIGRVPLALSWELPENVSRGQEISFRLRYISNSSRALANLWLRLAYPPGFRLISAEPAAKIGETIWELGALEPGREGFITVRGNMRGEEGETKTFVGELGLFNELTKEWKLYQASSASAKISTTQLSIQGLIDNTRDKIVFPGERLDFVLRYKNNTEVPLKNISVRATLDEKPLVGLLDFSDLDLGEGAFDFVSKALVWNAGSVNKLREINPGEEGELRFSIKTKENPIMKSEGDRNVTVKLKLIIEAAVAPEEFGKVSSSDELELKVGSKVLFSGKSLYRSSPITNMGPLPPTVGKKTTYVIFWEVRNFTNTLRNVEIRGLLPPNIKWEETYLPSDARVIYDSSSGEVRWRVGEVKAGLGVLSPALTLAFKISVIPAESDRGKSLILVRESILSGTDSFTEVAVEKRIEGFSTELKGDAGARSGEGIVE